MLYKVLYKYINYLFPFHAPVLEPDLDLPLREAQTVGNFDPSPPSEISIKVELFLQFQRLVAGVRRPLPLGLSVGIDRIYLKQKLREGVTSHIRSVPRKCAVTSQVRYKHNPRAKVQEENP